MEVFDFDDGNDPVDENIRRANRIRLALLKQSQRMQNYSMSNLHILKNSLKNALVSDHTDVSVNT